MKVEYVAYNFYGQETLKIINKILNSSKTVKVLSYGNFLCENNSDLVIIQKILREEYTILNNKRKLEFDKLPNLLEESIKQLLLPGENDSIKIISKSRLRG